MSKSNLIRNGQIVDNEWTTVQLPALGTETVRKQAGKVVLFKLTGEVTTTEEQIAATVIPAAGKIVVFNVPFDEYHKTVAVRTRGAIEASRVGAVASPSSFCAMDRFPAPRRS